jgi:hypothetical protein
MAHHEVACVGGIGANGARFVDIDDGRRSGLVLVVDVVVLVLGQQV